MRRTSFPLHDNTSLRVSLTKVHFFYAVYLFSLFCFHPSSILFFFVAFIYLGSPVSSDSVWGTSASFISWSDPLWAAFSASAALRASSSAALLAACSASTRSWTARRSASTFSWYLLMIGRARARISSILET